MRGEIDGFQSRNLTVVANNGMLRSGAAINLTPTKNMTKKGGNITKHRQQRVCRECEKYKTEYIYSFCYDSDIENWLCHTDTERSCLVTHEENEHENLKFIN